MKIKVLILVLLISITLIGCTSEKVSIDESESLELKQTKTLIIDGKDTDVNIIPKDIDNITVHLYGDIMTGEKLIPKLKTYRNDKRIRIYLDREEEEYIGMQYSNLKLDISVPKTYSKDIIVNNYSGNIDIRDFSINKLDFNLTSGNIYAKNLSFNTWNVKSSSSDMKISKINGDLLITSTSGDIDLNDLKGDLEVKTTSGDIKLKDVDGELSVNSTSGDIDINEANNKITIESTSGDVNLNINRNLNFTLNTHTNSGHIECNYKLNNFSKQDKSLTGSIGSGEHDINIKTTSGDINIGRK